MNPDGCKGCKCPTNNGNCLALFNGRGFIKIESVEWCPCRECLVKVMCRDACSDLKDLKKEVLIK